MKFKKIINLILIIAAVVSVLCSCSEKQGKTSSANTPQNNFITDSSNINGKRFSSTIYDFTAAYNNIMRATGENDVIIEGNWRKNGDETVDDRGVKIRYYYYDDHSVSFTATVEVGSGELVNIGCGTTMSYFMGQKDEELNSVEVLRKASIMAASARGYGRDKISELENVFYKTTVETDNTLWYDGCVYVLDTREDKEDSKNNIMLFRVFPISDSLRDEWGIAEYSG